MAQVRAFFNEDRSTLVREHSVPQHCEHASNDQHRHATPAPAWIKSCARTDGQPVYAAGISKWFFKNEGVEAYYTIAEELGRCVLAT